MQSNKTVQFLFAMREEVLVVTNIYKYFGTDIKPLSICDVKRNGKIFQNKIKEKLNMI